METFGQHLQRFALAVDIVSDKVFEKVFNLAVKQLEKNLAVVFSEFLVPTTVDDAPGLRSYFTRGGGGWSKRIKDAAGNYQGQISYAYDRGEPMWIVSDDKGPLRDVHTYLNLLSHSGRSEGIPRYVGLTDEPVLTSIIYPLLHDGERIGVINFESTEYLSSIRSLKQELKCIADSITSLFVLMKACCTQSQNTELAISALEQHKGAIVSGASRVFVASSANADEDVMQAVSEVLEVFDIRLEYWKNDAEPGDIRSHIWRKLLASELGICYFSEPAHGSDVSYRDNSNVLFEAGMMYAVVQTSSGMKAWIPIREINSPPLPFNLSTERALLVPRYPNGSLNKEKFREDLRARLRAVQTPTRQPKPRDAP
jgi:hypothetical protein